MLGQKREKVLGWVADAPNSMDQIVFDTDKGRVYCACGDAGVISVVSQTNTGLALLGNVPMHKKSYTPAVYAATHAVWIS